MYVHLRLRLPTLACTCTSDLGLLLLLLLQSGGMRPTRLPRCAGAGGAAGACGGPVAGLVRGVGPLPGAA